MCHFGHLSKWPNGLISMQSTGTFVSQHSPSNVASRCSPSKPHPNNKISNNKIPKEQSNSKGEDRVKWGPVNPGLSSPIIVQTAPAVSPSIKKSNPKKK